MANTAVNIQRCIHNMESFFDVTDLLNDKGLGEVEVEAGLELPDERRYLTHYAITLIPCIYGWFKGKWSLTFSCI